jgi:hypothetical protein
MFFNHSSQITLKLPFKNLMTPFQNLIIGGEDEQEEGGVCFYGVDNFIILSL